ncbi:LOW QUALITY PROTEIN: transcription factor IIIA [Bombina bombina]|uniref:LOW QUALITY PROTEIN: transcription factor IIIA n=1 Tax=Bombina bombina TaxID=8345 RepID=UPI00235AE481|nr:LOW QUALITY PROTEIN: transcription factor IIIA [Bombina bombina]
MAASVSSWGSSTAFESVSISDSGRGMGETAPPDVYKRYICSFADCNATYNKNWKLKVHLCKHTGEKPFSCEHEGCGKSFTTTYHLSRHSLTHSGEKSYKCESEDCDLKFSTRSNMKKHFKRAHKFPNQIYVCHFDDCGQIFKKHNQLKVHQFIHTNQKPYKCTHEGCEQSFSVPSKLKRHEKVHAGYPCRKDNLCSFVGKTWSEYVKHVAESHQGEFHMAMANPAICDVCNKNLKHKSYLKEHKKRHEKENCIFACPKEGCDRTYTTMFNLQNHIMSFHEEQRPFACDHTGCGKSFAMERFLFEKTLILKIAQSSSTFIVNLASCGDQIPLRPPTSPDCTTTQKTHVCERVTEETFREETLTESLSNSLGKL